MLNVLTNLQGIAIGAILIGAGIYLGIIIVWKVQGHQNLKKMFSAKVK